MKNKNIILFLLLVVAIGITYWFEERGNQNNLKDEAKNAEILNADNLGDIKTIRGIKLDMVKEGDNYFSRENHILMSPARLNEFFKILAGIKVKSTISNADIAKVGRSFYIADDAMKMTFTFEKGEISFSLGKKLSYDQTFYMEVTKGGKTQMVIASDESPDPGMYKDDKEYQKSEMKYQRLQMIFMLTNVYFYDTRIFKDIYNDPKTIHFDEITINTFRNRKYTINFKNTTTNPPAPPSLGYFEDNWLSFHQVLTKMEAKTVYAPFEESALEEILSQFEIKDREGRNITLRVYKKFGDLNGYFMTSSLEHVLYMLKPEEARFFFVNVQDFWNKKIAPKTKDYQLSLTFVNNKTEIVNVSDKELFNVVSINKKTVRPLEFKKLIEFLKMEGDHVSDLTEKQSEILKKTIMTIRFENKTLNLVLEDNDAILVDVDAKIKIHHYVGATVPFSTKYSDYVQ